MCFKTPGKSQVNGQGATVMEIIFWVVFDTLPKFLFTTSEAKCDY